LDKKNKNNYIDLGERGKYNTNNKLNDLTGKEWIKFTKSWFLHNPPRRKEDEILHPAKFPETLVQEFIEFFTKKDAWIFDPFLGTGSTLVASGNAGRNALGIELNPDYFLTSQKRVGKNHFENKLVPLKGSSKDLHDLLKKNNFEDIKFDYTITSPPYWNQLKRNSIRQSERKERGLDTIYSDNFDDIGNIEEYENFLEQQAEIFDRVYEVMKPNSYLTVITNNVYFNGRLFPLAFDTATSLTKRGDKSWTLKDERIWLQDDKRLIALGVNTAWVGNRHHQYCLIFRKEE
jgi:DNA modification methylase